MNTRPFWIGLVDQKNEGHFAWESGRNLSVEVENYWGHNQPEEGVWGLAREPSFAGRRICTRVNATTGNDGKMYAIDCVNAKEHVVCQLKDEKSKQISLKMVITCQHVTCLG